MPKLTRRPVRTDGGPAGRAAGCFALVAAVVVAVGGVARRAGGVGGETRHSPDGRRRRRRCKRGARHRRLRYVRRAGRAGRSQGRHSQTTQTSPGGNGSVTSYLADQNLNLPAQNASVELTVASQRFAAGMMKRLQVVCTSPEVRRIAAEGRPATGTAPPEYRTLPYKAAALYIDDCARFANALAP